MKTITKDLLARKVAEQMDVTIKVGKEIVSTVIDTIVGELVAGNEVKITNFGTFGVADVDAAVKRNPATGAEVEVAAHKKPTFKYSNTIKTAVR